MTTLGIVWFFLIFLLIAGYFVLDGFDLGAGVLMPFIASDEQERCLIRRAIGPVWDGNEVWLLTAGGALFAAFAPAYATTFSGFYLAIMLVLFGLILRAVALEFASHDPAWSGLWNVCFVVGSLLPALLLGVAVGNIYAGIPMDAAGNYTGIPLLGLVTPFTLLTGLLGLSMFCSAGASWMALKAPATSAVRAKSVSLRRIFQALSILLFFLVSAYGHFLIAPAMEPVLSIARWACAILVVACLLCALLVGNTAKQDAAVFVLQSIAAVALTFLLATSMFPNLVVASAGSVGQSITIATAASSDTALFAMTVIACIGVPLVLLYHVIVYRTFRGRLEA
ncbi:MAG: cytochrome d ubiquinol oxidase subunit II [Eggerthellaceae bacterium]|nr:cytochrome d ubiquinol oxidase subunit II [Eggerthellaceae bacterium]